MTHKKGAKLQPQLKLDMPFGEALVRFTLTNPKEVEAGIKRSKQKRPGGKKRKRQPPGQKSKNVVLLKARRERKRNYGR